MEMKFIVSMFVYYLYIFLKNKIDLEINRNIWKWNVDYLWIFVGLMFFISNIQARLSFFVCISLVITLLFLWQNKNVSLKNKTYFIQKIILMVIYMIPSIFYMIFFQEKYLIYFYIGMGLFSLLSPFLVKKIKICAKKKKSCIIEKRRSRKSD